MSGKPEHELWAEALRESGILLAVFGPLETLLRSGKGADWLIAAGVVFFGGASLALGVRVETGGGSYWVIASAVYVGAELITVGLKIQKGLGIYSFAADIICLIIFGLVLIAFGAKLRKNGT
jgi:hypothetical protein